MQKPLKKDVLTPLLTAGPLATELLKRHDNVVIGSTTWCDKTP